MKKLLLFSLFIGLSSQQVYPANKAIDENTLIRTALLSYTAAVGQKNITKKQMDAFIAEQSKKRDLGSAVEEHNTRIRTLLTEQSQRCQAFFMLMRTNKENVLKTLEILALQAKVFSLFSNLIASQSLCTNKHLQIIDISKNREEILEVFNKQKKHTHKLRI